MAYWGPNLAILTSFLNTWGFSSFSFHSRVSNLAIYIDDASQPQEKRKRKRKRRVIWSLSLVSYMSPTVSANAQFWLHSAHIPCMQSFVLFLDFFARAAATLGHCHFQFCCFFQQRKWKSSKEILGLHTCRNSGPGSHHLLPFFFVFFFRRKVIFAASSNQDSNVCSFNTVMIQIRSGFA